MVHSLSFHSRASKSTVSITSRLAMGLPVWREEQEIVTYTYRKDYSVHTRYYDSMTDL